MKHSLFSSQIKKGLQATLLLVMLLFNLSPSGTLIAYAAPPSNDNFSSAILISAIPYTNSISTLEATAAPDDPQVTPLCDNKLLAKGLATVWYKYTPVTKKPISIDTIGTNYDTYIAVWTGPNINSLSLVACDDDNNAGLQSQLAFTAKAGITYYIEVAQYNGTRSPSAAPQKSAPKLQALSGGILKFHVRQGANIEAHIGGTLRGDYLVAAQSSKKASYTGVDLGPVKVLSLQSVPIVASQRVSYSPDGGATWTGFSEMMGLPADQLHSSYTFPWYNNVSLDSQLRFANMGTVITNVTVKISNVINLTYKLKPGESKRIKYSGVDKGPVRVNSSGGVPIIASIRVAYTPDSGTTWTSFSEMIGLPSNKLTTSYMFPWYNNLTLNSELRFANVGTSNTKVKVFIKGVLRGTYTLAPNASKHVSFPGVDEGPVKIQSSNGVPIIASMRVSYSPDGGTTWTSFSELMGLPTKALGTKYAFPIYNSVNLNSQLRFANVGTINTKVKVFIGGALQGAYTLGPNTSKRVSYNNIDNGPILVQSSGGVPIIASLRVAYTPDGGTTWTDFSEMIGLPRPQWTTTYIFPWYNNVNLNSQLRFGVP